MYMKISVEKKLFQVLYVDICICNPFAAVVGVEHAVLWKR